MICFREGVDENGKMKTRVMVNTPYGGRLVVRLPAGTLLFVHLKDKKLIRHKKRWSQVGSLASHTFKCVEKFKRGWKVHWVICYVLDLLIHDIRDVVLVLCFA